MQIGLNGVKTYVDFEVIVILDDTYPYVALSGLIGHIIMMPCSI
jgi:hypothetical protein